MKALLIVQSEGMQQMEWVENPRNEIALYKSLSTIKERMGIKRGDNYAAYLSFPSKANVPDEEDTFSTSPF